MKGGCQSEEGLGGGEAGWRELMGRLVTLVTAPFSYEFDLALFAEHKFMSTLAEFSEISHFTSFSHFSRNVAGKRFFFDLISFYRTRPKYCKSSSGQGSDDAKTRIKTIVTKKE